jgi:hypothetical protein
MDNISMENILEAVSKSNSFIDVLKNLNLELTNSNKKRLERRIRRLEISVEHFDSIKRVKEYKERYENIDNIKYLVEKNETLKDVLHDLNLLAVTSNYNTLKKYLKENNINFEKFNEKNEKFSESNLKNIVADSDSYKDCLLKLNIRSAGGNYKTLKKYIKLYNIDVSHFNFKNENLLNKSKPLDDILVENSTYSRRSLKERLYKYSILERVCSLCGQDENWNGMKIALILDHINGVHNDNRLENLRIVCPNCNAGLDTFAGKNNKKRDSNFCECGKVIHKSSEKCNTCRGFESRKLVRPSLEEILKEVEENGYSATGRKYGVSDNAIRKWIKNRK